MGDERSTLDSAERESLVLAQKTKALLLRVALFRTHNNTNSILESDDEAESRWGDAGDWRRGREKREERDVCGVEKGKVSFSSFRAAAMCARLSSLDGNGIMNGKVAGKAIEQVSSHSQRRAFLSWS